jgi:hypothetical protein
MKDQLTQLIRERGLRLVLETIAAICAAEADSDRADVDEWRDWDKARLRLLKMSQDMIL